VASVGLRTRRLRAGLSALGIAIGIAAMVAVLGISESSKAGLLAELDRLGTNLLTVTPGQTFFGEAAEPPAAADRAVRNLSSVRDAAAVTELAASVRRSPYIEAAETSGIKVEAADSTLLRTLGGSVTSGFLGESVLLSLLGGAAGIGSGSRSPRPMPRPRAGSSSCRRSPWPAASGSRRRWARSPASTPRSAPPGWRRRRRCGRRRWLIRDPRVRTRHAPAVPSRLEAADLLALAGRARVFDRLGAVLRLLGGTSVTAGDVLELAGIGFHALVTATIVGGSSSLSCRDS
jgi:hypothetical protein